MRLAALRMLAALAVLATSLGTAPGVLAEDGQQDNENGQGTSSPIKHTIILYQENISFDHYFGTYGHGASGIPAGVKLFHTNDTSGQRYGPYSPFRLDGQTQKTTCDVDHSYTDMIRMANHGAMDLYLQFGNNKAVTNPSNSTAATCPSLEVQTAGPALALGYYEGEPGSATAPLQNYWKLARQYVLADNFFQAMQGPSTPGAEWLVAATSNTSGDPNPIGDVCNDYPATISPQGIPNLGAEASARGVSWAWFQGGFGKCKVVNGILDTQGYIAHHDPFQYFTSTADPNHQWAMDPHFDQPQANRHQRDLDVLYSALAGTPIGSTIPRLPAISWVKAKAPNDGHPAYSNPMADDAFVGDLVHRIQTSRYWKDTALVIAFDETGGWWDHVATPELSGPFAPWVNGQPNQSGCQYAPPPYGEGGLGPRMPVLIVSPFTRRAFVDHDRLETSSLVNWVEWNHRLPALGVWGNRDVVAGSLSTAFKFGEQGDENGGGG